VGPCDPAEACTGASASCPLDSYSPLNTVCRAAQGPCDKQEICAGNSASCPIDLYQLKGTLCRKAEDLCDKEELCDGTSTDCPPNQYHPQNTPCRQAAGECDLAEACDGHSAKCPANALKEKGSICRDAFDPECDLQESCNGLSATCPKDQWQNDFVLCDKGKGVCLSGKCKPLPPDAGMDAGVDAKVDAGKKNDSAVADSGKLVDGNKGSEGLTTNDMQKDTAGKGDGQSDSDMALDDSKVAEDGAKAHDQGAEGSPQDLLSDILLTDKGLAGDKGLVGDKGLAEDKGSPAEGTIPSGDNRLPQEEEDGLGGGGKSGCSCRIGHAPQSSELLWGVVLFFALWLRRRSRR
jgi:MYXO-CTERM domain-containing protein